MGIFLDRARKGKFRWDAVDAFVNQLNSPDEGLIGLFSTSTWAVEKPGMMLPPSPAKNPDDYYQFVHAVVAHCKRRVRFWQNDSEPNNPIYWAGTKEQFVAEIKHESDRIWRTRLLRVSSESQVRALGDEVDASDCRRPR
jgi:hypothetical protein